MKAFVLASESLRGPKLQKVSDPTTNAGSSFRGRERAPPTERKLYTRRPITLEIHLYSASFGRAKHRLSRSLPHPRMDKGIDRRPGMVSMRHSR